MRADELHRQRQAERPRAERQGDAGRAEHGPEAVEDRIAGVAEAGRRLAARGRHQQDIEALPHLGEIGSRAFLGLPGVGELRARNRIAELERLAQARRQEMREALALRSVMEGRLLGHDPVVRVISASQLSGISQGAHLGAGRAQRLHGGFDVLLIVALGLVPPARAAEADARRLRRRIGRRVPVGGTDQGEVVGLAREEAQRVEALE
jgi:hypothetical protein